MLVLHGDEFDSVVKCSPWAAKLGSNICEVLLAASPYINWLRRKFDLPHWSLSSYLKNKAKTAVQYIGSFEDAVAQAARKRGVDGVVCGHIHHAEMREINGILYCNDGDWVESCTALVEHFDGRLELINWIDRWALDPLSEGAPAAAEVEVDDEVHEVPALLGTD